MEHSESVDDSARRIQTSELLQTTCIFQTLQHGNSALVQTLRPFADSTNLLRETDIEGLSNLLWLANATALDDHVVELCQLGKSHKLFKEVASERATDAAIL